MGFAKAVEEAQNQDTEKIKNLRDKLIENLLKIEGTRLNGDKETELTKIAEKLGVADHTLWNSRTGAISQSELKGRAPHLGTKYPAYK